MKVLFNSYISEVTVNEKPCISVLVTERDYVCSQQGQTSQGHENSGTRSQEIYNSQLNKEVMRKSFGFSLVLL